MNGKATRRIGRLSLALAMALMAVASIGVASASARMWIEKFNAGYGYYFDIIHTGTDFESVDSGTSLEAFLFDGTDPTINCTDGDLTVAGEAGADVPLYQESLPFDTAFSGCTATGSNFPTTVDMGNCGMSLKVGRYEPDGATYYARTQGYIDCSGGGGIEMTSYLRGTKLCTVTLYAHGAQLKGSTVNWWDGFRVVDATSGDLAYYTEGGWCPQDGSLYGARLRLNMELIPAA